MFEEGEANFAGDLRQERDVFIKVLSEAGEIAISDDAFYDIVHDVHLFCEEPERVQQNAEIRSGKKLVDARHPALRRLTACPAAVESG